MPHILNTTDKESVILERLLLVLELLLPLIGASNSLNHHKKFGCKIVVQEAPEFIEAAKNKESLLNKE